MLPVDPDHVVQRLLRLQATIRQQVMRSSRQADQHEARRSSSADTIYAIDERVDPIIEQFCLEWSKSTPLVLVAEGLVDENGVEGARVFPPGTADSDALIRIIIDPIDGTRGLMYDKRPAWTLAGVAPNKGPETRLSDVEVAVMSELPASKMAYADVLWAIKGRGARGQRVNLQTNDTCPIVFEPVGGEKSSRPFFREEDGGQIGSPAPQTTQFTEKSSRPVFGPSRATSIDHGFVSVSNFFPGTKVLASELTEYLVRHLIGPADVTRATVFEDQYISTGGQWYELMAGHDRFNADLRPLFYKAQNLPQGMCCHPYDCAAMLIAQEAGVIITDGLGRPLDAPLDTTTGVSWAGFANPALRDQIEPLLLRFLYEVGATNDVG